MKASSIILISICFTSAAYALGGRHHSRNQVTRITCNWYLPTPLTLSEIKSFLIAQKCYCDEEAIAIQACLDANSPNYPFLPSTGRQSRDCPSPISDSRGFQECIARQTPQLDPNGPYFIQRCSQNKIPQFSKTTPTAGSESSNSGGFGLVILLVSTAFLMLA
jgi:hypothetical protein